MKVEVISIGDELLIGQTVNTNASWIGVALRDIGASVEFGTVIQDEKEAMKEAFDLALSRVDVVLVTGGLGPTKDDITKHVLTEYFDGKLVRNEDVLAHVKSYFDSRGREMLDVNIQQSYVPDTADVLHNEYGTAPGMWFEQEGKILVSMPGVPYEMKYIMSTGVIPRLQGMFELDKLYYQTLQLQGIGETNLAERISDIETKLREDGFGVAYLPSPGVVRLRVSANDTAENREVVEGAVSEVAQRLPKFVFGKEEETLEEVIGRLLKEKGVTVTTVESCTGGALASAITSVAGASEYFNGALVTYSNEMKSSLVGVKETTLKSFGAVSQQVVEEMAVGGKNRMNATYAISLSGVAGPTGGTADKPVGTVWIAVAGPKGIFSKRFQFEINRERNIRRSVLTALNLLRCEILGLNLEKS